MDIVQNIWFPLCLYYSYNSNMLIALVSIKPVSPVFLVCCAGVSIILERVFHKSQYSVFELYLEPIVLAPPFSQSFVYARKDEFIVSRIYRMPIYRTFSYIEEYIVSNLPYRVSRYSQNQWFFCLFSPKIPKILRKFWKFPENSENPWTKVVNNNNSAENSKNSPKILKIRRKFLKKKVFFEALISYRIVSYREKNPHIVSISYRIEKKLIATQCSWPGTTIGRTPLKHSRVWEKMSSSAT